MKRFTGAIAIAMLLKVIGFSQPVDSIALGTWLGEYSGYDPQTKSIVTITRKLIIEKTDDIYYDTLWGQPTQSDTIIFEMEIGTWAINFTFDSIIWTPIVSKHIDIANPDSLVEYDHGVHMKELNHDLDLWGFHDDNMNVDYTMFKEEVIEIPGTPTGDVLPTIDENYDYNTSGAKSNLEHTLEYSFNWGDGTSSEWSSSKISSHIWSTTGLKYVTVTARCVDHPDRMATSDSLAVDVQDKISGINYNSLDKYSFRILNNNFRSPGSPVIISYSVPARSYVSLSVYNMQGQLVRSLVSSHHNTGNYETEWDGKDNSGNSAGSGVFFYIFTAKDYYSVQKGVLAE
jgi:hypothetical protein